MKLNQEEREAVDRIVFSEDFKTFMQAIDALLEKQKDLVVSGGFRDANSIAYDAACFNGMKMLRNGIEGFKAKLKSK